MSEPITLRDYFAAAALTAIIPNPSVSVNTPEVMVQVAYEFADLMLEARKGKYVTPEPPVASAAEPLSKPAA